MIFPYSKPNPKVQTPEPETQKVEEKKGYLKSQGKSQEKSSQQEKASSAKTITVVVQPTEEIPSTSKPDMMSTPALDEKQVRKEEGLSKPSNNEPKKKIENTSGSANGVQPESSRKFSPKEEAENEKVSAYAAPTVPSSKSEARKIMQKKSNIIEKANQRASALNITKISPKLVFATGASTLRSVRLEEMQVTLVILASTAEDLENSWTTPTLEGVDSKVIVLDENRDNESQIEKYLHMVADWVSETEEKRGVAMIHAPEGGVFKKANGSGSSDSRRGEGFAAALCAAYLIKYDGQTAKQALESIK